MRIGHQRIKQPVKLEEISDLSNLFDVDFGVLGYLINMPKVSEECQS